MNFHALIDQIIREIILLRVQHPQEIRITFRPDDPRPVIKIVNEFLPATNLLKLRFLELPCECLTGGPLRVDKPPYGYASFTGLQNFIKEELVCLRPRISAIVYKVRDYD